MPEEFLRKVKEILFPKLGEMVALSTIRVSCQRMGIKPEDLSRENVDEFLENIKISLLLFLDESETKKISSEIKSISMG